MGKLDGIISNVKVSHTAVAASQEASGEVSRPVFSQEVAPAVTPAPASSGVLSGTSLFDTNNSTVTLEKAQKEITLSTDVFKDCRRIQKMNFSEAINMTRRLSMGEEFKKLRTNLMHLHERDAYQTFMLTSSRHAEGKTTTLVSLSRFMGELNDLKVCLVDCDMRRPRVRVFCGLNKIEHGIDDVIEQGVDLTKALVYSMEDNLAVLPCRRGRANAAELLDNPRMDAIIETLRRDFDLVLFDTPPVVSTTDPIVLGTRMDAVFVAVKTSFTQRAQLNFVLRQLDSADINFVGLVLTHHKEVLPKVLYRYVYYHDYYGYYYYHKDPETGVETKKLRQEDGKGKAVRGPKNKAKNKKGWLSFFKGSGKKNKA